MMKKHLSQNIMSSKIFLVFKQIPDQTLIKLILKFLSLFNELKSNFMINLKFNIFILKFQIIKHPEYQVINLFKYQVNKYNFLIYPI